MGSGMRCKLLPMVLAVLATWQQAAADNRVRALEETLVTAQHRSESAQSIPISLFTMNFEQLKKQRINGIASLNGLVPNLDIDSFPANNQTLRLFIRGVGLTDTQVTQDAAVGVYLNGAYIARSTGLALDVVELERIEILRGPQGTLYGRNTTGGALNLITKKPDMDNVTFDQTLSTGNQDLFSSKTSINLPLASKYAAKAAYFYQDVDGFVNNDGPGGGFGDRESKGFRLDFRAELSAALTLDYGYDWSDIRYYNYTAQAVTPRDPLDLDLLGIVGVIAEQYIDYSNNKFSSLSTSVPLLPTDTTIDGHTLNLNWAINDAMSLRSITAYRELDDKSYIDFSSGASEEFRIDYTEAIIGARAGEDRLDLPTVRPHLEQEQFSQELHLFGKLGESIDYMFGVYYFYEKAEEDARALHHIFSVYPFDNGTLYNIGGEYNKIRNDALAFFTQATWTPDTLDKKLHLTLGWRHSRDSRDAEREVTNAYLLDSTDSVSELLPTSVFVADADNDYDDDSFTFVAQYDWTDSIHVYGKYAEAYKSGGFNIRDPQEQGFSNGFDEEKLRSGELGFKGELLDHVLRVNAALFYQKYEDFQYNFQIPGSISGTRVFNVDEGEMSGVELDLTAMPVAGLLLQLSYAYLDSELDDIENPFTGDQQQFNFTNAPQNTYSFMVDYTWPTVAMGVLNVNASYNFVDDRLGQNEAILRDSYKLVNGRLSLSQIEGWGGQWSIALWGKNLSDEEYQAFALDNLPQASRAVIWGDGRTYGLDISYSLD
jgi:iron complex outermembrane receptor protein